MRGAPTDRTVVHSSLCADGNAGSNICSDQAHSRHGLVFTKYVRKMLISTAFHCATVYGRSDCAATTPLSLIEFAPIGENLTIPVWNEGAVPRRQCSDLYNSVMSVINCYNPFRPATGGAWDDIYLKQYDTLFSISMQKGVPMQLLRMQRDTEY